MESPIQELLTPVLKTAIADAGFGEQCGSVPFEWALSQGFGDISTNIAMRIASVAKQPPIKIASEITEAFRKRLADSPCRASVDQVKAEGAGFINVYLSDGYFQAGP